MSGIRKKLLINNIGILFLFIALMPSCSRTYYIEPSEVIEYAGISYGELGDLLIVTDSNDILQNIIVVDTTYGINIYDSLGQLLSYYNEVGIGKLSFSHDIIRSGDPLDLIIGYIPSDGSVICYEWNRMNHQLKAILQFNQQGLADANNCCDASRNDSLQLLFTAQDSSLTRWAFVFDDSIATSISFIEQDKLDFKADFISIDDEANIELIDSKGGWHSLSNDKGSEFHFGNHDWKNMTYSPTENTQVFFSGTDNTIYISEDDKGIKYRVKLVNAGNKKLKRIKTISFNNNKVILAGEFYDKESKKLYIGILIGIGQLEK